MSILGTFCFFIPLGFTINTLTMFGFVLAIGIVVDDAIIVVEAVQHYIDEQHMSAKEATYHAMKEISAPVVAIALILAAVFVPVGFIPGIVGRLYQQFAITIAISVISVRLYRPVADTGALYAAAEAARSSKEKKLAGQVFAWFNAGFERFIEGYTHGVRRSIRYSWGIILLLLGICVGAYFLFEAKPSGFCADRKMAAGCSLRFQLADASSTTESVEVMEKIMQVVNSTPGILHYVARFGVQYPKSAAPRPMPGPFLSC